MLLPLAALAQTPFKEGPSSYERQAWSGDQGFSGGTVYSIAQTPDGYLWVGAERGLLRFDGFQFRFITPEELPGWVAGSVQQLVVDGRGDLWVRKQNMQLLRLHGGVFEDVLATEFHDDRGATAMCRGTNGDVIAWARAAGLLRFHGEKWSTVASAAQRPQTLVIAMAESESGALWLGTRDQGLFVWDRGRAVQYFGELPDVKVNAILPLSANEVWIGTDGGMVRWTAGHLTHGGVPPELAHQAIFALSKDSESNVWVGVEQALLRLKVGQRDEIQEVSREANAGAHAVFADRERNLWTGGDEGVQRYRDDAFLNYSMAADGTAHTNGPVYVDAEGRTWVGGEGPDVEWTKGAQHGRVRVGAAGGDAIYAFAGHGNVIWAGTRLSGLVQVQCREDCAVKERAGAGQGLPRDSILSLYDSGDGSVWVGTVRSGALRWKGGQVTVRAGGEGNAVFAMAGTPDGTLWFGTADGLTSFVRGEWRSYASGTAMPEGAVECLALDEQGTLWIGTERGLAWRRGGMMREVESLPRLPGEKIKGIAADRFGFLWLVTSRRVVRFDRAQVLADRLNERQARTYGASDGLLSGASDRFVQPIATDASGRIWLASVRGVFAVDPAKLSRDGVPSLVHIESVTADSTRVVLQNVIRIPAGRRRVAIQFVGLSLGEAQNVRYRYKLDDFDRDWSPPVSVREAVYTNLSPGTYRFHVLATNGAGTWNRDETSAVLRVEPSFWQTWWFRSLGVGGICAGVFAIYRLKLQQVTSELDARFEERLRERTRIAQDLHDTVLQGFLSASMQLHVAAGRLESDSRAKAPLERAMQLMTQASNEGRAALKHLRSTERDEVTLEQTLSSIPDEVFLPEGLTMRLRVEGKPRPVRPVLRDDVYRICREAIVNAIRHSKASEIEVEIVYAFSELCVSVEDNGCGMDAHVMQQGKQGHWGIQGMRERADRIGATLAVLSHVGAGTEVVLSVPGHVAFPSRNRRGWSWWSRRAQATRQTHGQAETGDI